MLANARLVMTSDRQALNVGRTNAYMTVLLGSLGVNESADNSGGYLGKTAGFLRSRDPATRNGPKQYPFTIELRLGERDLTIVNMS